MGHPLEVKGGNMFATFRRETYQGKIFRKFIDTQILEKIVEDDISGNTISDDF